MLGIYSGVLEKALARKEQRNVSESLSLSSNKMGCTRDEMAVEEEGLKRSQHPFAGNSISGRDRATVGVYVPKIE